ncbi:MAG: hypothetical protein OK439_03030 [Thaumarchaeota archaeon]|nr:hypothetical protein [Nitrososphaerota archaeon]
MSFSGGSGRSFGKKGHPASQKKERKKKQDYHKHRLKFTPEQHLDFAEMKNRVSIALDRLGNQVFAPEPGGYDFTNWMSSFNLLLDDFEEKASPDNLPQEYFESRQKNTAELLLPVDTAEIDSEIRKLEEEINSIMERISSIGQRSNAERNQERIESSSKIEMLRKERAESDIEMSRAKSALEEQKKVESRLSSFGKIFSRSSTSPVKLTLTKISSLASRQNEIDEDLHSLAAERAKRQSTKDDSKKEIASLRAELESLQQKLGELESLKQEKLQYTERRKEVTKAMSGVISVLQLHIESDDSSPEQGDGDFVPLN